MRIILITLIDFGTVQYRASTPAKTTPPSDDDYDSTQI